MHGLFKENEQVFILDMMIPQPQVLADVITKTAYIV